MSDETEQAHPLGEIAFEHNLPKAPQKLWCVRHLSTFADRILRHSNWFATEDEALAYASSIKASGREVLNVFAYTLTGSSA